MESDSRRDAELVEALGHMAATAGRMPAFDHLGRLNEVHADMHAKLNDLLTEWEFANQLAGA